MKRHLAESFAMDASSNMRSCFYRSGYDFAVPLRHQVGFGNLTYVAPWHREYFLTVKVREAKRGPVRHAREGGRRAGRRTACFRGHAMQFEDVPATP